MNEPNDDEGKKNFIEFLLIKNFTLWIQQQPHQQHQQSGFDLPFLIWLLL